MSKRRIVVIAGVLVLASAALILWRGGSRTPLPVFSESYIALVESVQRDQHGELPENRWDIVEELVDLVFKLTEADRELPRHEQINMDVITGHRRGTARAREQAIDIVLGYDAGGLSDLLDELAAARRFMRPAQDEYQWDWQLPELGILRIATRYSSARMELMLERGDVKEAARSFEHILAVSRVASQDPFLISRLVSLAAAARAYEMLQEYMVKGPPGAAEIRLFAESIERQWAHPPLAFSFAAESLAILDMLRMIYDHPTLTPSQVFVSLGESEPAPSRFDAAFETRVLGGGMPSRERAIASSQQVAALLDEAAQRPMHERDDAIQELGDYVEQLRLRDSLEVVLRGPMMKLTTAHLAVEALTSGMRLMLAIELYRAERGELPEVLSALIPEYLAELPPDLYTGEPFIYRVLAPGTDEHGRRYLLYATGLDGVDDGGIESEREHNRMTGTLAGRDLVINGVRQRRPIVEEEEFDDPP
jgi:hypothetical protein